MSTATQIPTGTWTLDPVHSSVGFAVKHMVVATFRGTFEDYDATLTVGEDGNARLEGIVQVRSIKVKDENLGVHLLGPDFFDAERTPEIRFSSEVVRIDGDQIVTDGELSIRGVTRPVEARGTITGPVEHFAGGERIGLELTTNVDRTQYGLNWNAPLPKGGMALANDVQLIVSLELAQQG